MSAGCDVLAKLPVPTVVRVLDEAGTTRCVNDAFVAAFGYTLEDVPTAAAWAEKVYPDPVYRQQVLARWWSEITARRATGKITPPGEYRVIDKAGRPRDVLIDFALHDDHAIVTMQDITNVRTTEAALAAERRKTDLAAHALTENMPAGAYTIVLRPGDTAAQFAFISQRYLDMMGVTRESLISDPVVTGVGDTPVAGSGNPFAAFVNVHPDDMPHLAALRAKAAADKAPISVEFRVRVHGRTRWMRAESVPRMLEDGSVLWEGILVDITKVKETEYRLKTVIDAARAMTWHLDLTTDQVIFNEVWTEVHGYLPQDNAPLLSIWQKDVHPDDVGVVRSAIGRLVSGVSKAEQAVYRRRHRDGQWLWFQVHGGVSERDAAGRPAALSGVTFDITAELAERQRAQDEQAQLREELQRAQQRDTVAQIAGGVAHDLNNLIGIVLWTLEVLEPRCADQPELSDGLTRIRRAIDMARDLIADLGGLVRREIPQSEHDLRQLLTASIDLLGSRRIAHHSVQIELPDDPLPVWANPTELLQVVVNLAINACDAGVPLKVAQVTLGARPQGTPTPQRPPDAGEAPIDGLPMSIFVVSDTGRGITPDVRAACSIATSRPKAAKAPGWACVSSRRSCNATVPPCGWIPSPVSARP